MSKTVKKITIPRNMKGGDFLVLENGSRIKFRKWSGGVAICHKDSSEDNYSMYSWDGQPLVAPDDKQHWVVGIERAKRPQAQPKITYNVYVSQVNQAVVTVRASSEEEARDKGAKKWLKEYATAHILSVEAPSGTPAK